MGTNSGDDDASLPWYLKVLILVAILVILFIIGIDIIAFSEAL